MDSPSRQIRVRVNGDAVHRAKIPLRVLIHVFDKLQNAVNLMGRFHLEKGQIGVRGPLPRRVREECDLRLAATTEGSFVATLELPEKAQRSFSNGFSPDLGVQSLETLAGVLVGVGAEDEAQIRVLLPDGIVRNRALRLLRDLTPKAGERYSLDLFIGQLDNGIKLDSSSRVKLNRFLEEPKTETHRRLLGRVIELQIDPTRWFHIWRKGRRIKCYFNSDVEPILLQSVGQLVEIEGRVQVDTRGRLQSVPEVHDVEIVTMEPLAVDVVTGHALRFVLSRPLFGEVSYDQGWFIIENRHLGIFSYGETRAEALMEFERDFEVLWQEYVEVSEDSLTLDARELRKLLRDIVLEVSPR